MAVPDQDPISSHVASGASGVFAYSFQIAAASDLAVTANGALLTLNVDYTVAGIGVESGGTITVTPTPAPGVVITIYRDTALERLDDFQTAGDLPAAQVNLELDRLWRALQEIFSGGKGSPTALRVPQGETVPALPAAASRALKMLVFDSAGNPVVAVTPTGTAADVLVQLLNAIDVTKGDALIGAKLTDTGAIATDHHELNERRVPEVFDFMTPAQIADVCSATPALDHSDLLQSAIDAAQVLGKGERRLRINGTQAGYYRITKPLVVTSNFLTVEWDSTNAIIKKFFNGDMFQIYGGDVEFNRCGLDGNGATYTGGGIRLMSASANSFRLINPRIKETASAPLLIEANAGSLMKVIGGLLQPYNAASAGPTHGVAMAGVDASPANRKLIGVSMGGAPIMDASGAETVQIVGCDGSKITTSSTSKKISATGNRMQTAGANNLISGVDHCFVANTMASSFELAPGATNCVVKENVTVGVEVIDTSGNSSNKVTFYGSAFTPTWTGSGSNPSLGNGTLTGLYDRNDRHVTVTVDLTIGSTTTLGTGEYSFGLPLQAVSGRSFVGSAWLSDAGTAFYVGTVLVVAGSTTAQVYFNAGASAMSPTVPIALANGDRLRFQITYVPT